MPDGPSPPSLPLLPDRVARPSRELPPVDRDLRRRVVVLLLLVHVLGLLLLDQLMQPPVLPARMLAEDSIEIVFGETATESIAASAPESPDPRLALPQAASPATTPAAPQLAATPAAPPAAASATVTGESPPMLDEPLARVDSARLFDPDGSLRISPQVVDAAATRAQQPDFTPPPAARWPTVKSPLPYKATRFEPYWVKSNETMGEELFRHVIFEKEFKTPWGTRWRCAYIVIIGGCGDVPPPPMKNPPKMPWETYLPLPDSREAEGDDGF